MRYYAIADMMYFMDVHMQFICTASIWRSRLLEEGKGVSRQEGIFGPSTFQFSPLFKVREKSSVNWTERGESGKILTKRKASNKRCERNRDYI